MNKYKVCVYAICKNEEPFVDRWMDAVSEADLVIVTDTGSTDQTVSRLRERGAIVYEEKITPWRFDVARNVAMSHIPHDVDICVSNDLDEIFEKGWREKLERAWKKEYTRARYMFTWAFDSKGNPIKQFEMEKIHQRHHFKWIHPVHEVLVYQGHKQEKTVNISDLVLNHYPDQDKPRTQYLPLLELSAKENPSDPQTIFWLGREYFYYQNYTKAIQTLKQYLELKEAIWPEERAAAMRFIGKCYKELSETEDARKWFYQAIAQCPTIREPYLDFIELGYYENDWPLILFLSTEALKIKESSGSYLVELEAWHYAFYDYQAIACYQLGLYERSYIQAKKALSYEPSNPRLRHNVSIIRKKIEEVF